MQLKTFCPYLVGDVYITTGNHSPSTVWPGTSWQAIEGKFLVGANADYTGGSTGGSATHSHTTGDCTLTTNQIPSHNHSVGAHAHGLNSHTHSLQSHTHTTTLGSHDHSVTTTAKKCENIITISDATLKWSSNRYAGGDFAGVGATDRSIYVNIPSLSGTAASKDLGSKTSGGPSNNTSGAASGNTANSAAFNSGTAGGSGAHNHGNTGSGSNLPPYLAVYMWKRVA